ncbi:MAG: hypothetical protein HKM07_02130 [Chlamydiae bacterium]|nr:hypothetical protein [Chlamydiota bacterium]
MAVHVHQHITNSSTPSPTPSSIRLPSEEEQEILGEFKEQISACGFNLTNPASNYKIYYNSDPIEVQKLADNIPAFRNKALALFTEFKTAPAREEVLQILLLLLKHDPRQKNSSELLVGFIKEVVTSMKSSENESTERCITLCRVYTAAIDCLLQNINDENYRALRHQT